MSSTSRKRSECSESSSHAPLAAQFDHLFFIGGEEVERRHRLHRKTEISRRVSHNRSIAAPARTYHCGSARGTVTTMTPELELTAAWVRRPSTRPARQSRRLSMTSGAPGVASCPSEPGSISRVRTSRPSSRESRPGQRTSCIISPWISGIRKRSRSASAEHCPERDDALTVGHHPKLRALLLHGARHQFQLRGVQRGDLTNAAVGRTTQEVGLEKLQSPGPSLRPSCSVATCSDDLDSGKSCTCPTRCRAAAATRALKSAAPIDR